MPKRRSVRRKGHPLATGKDHRVRLARLILWDRSGGGPMPCNWCGRRLVWKTGGAARDEDAICADHVDGDLTNDEEGNIVASCRRCNVNRWRGEDWNRELIDCDWCHRRFLPRWHRQVFCSRSCAASWRNRYGRHPHARPDGRRPACA